MSKIFLTLALITAPVCAQGVIYHEGFENGLAGWTPTGTFGLWNAESATDPCGSTVAPFPEGTGAAYYGVDLACSYTTGVAPNWGELQMNSWIDLPAGAASISLHYWSWSESEYCYFSYDAHEVIVDVESPPSSVHVPYCDGSAHSSLLLPWHERRVDLTSFAGSRVRLRFAFDTGDGEQNQYRGWFIDDLSVVVEAGVRVCPESGLQSGCPCALAFVPVAGGCRNSTTHSATMRSSGTPSVAADTLQVRAEHMPPNASALLVQASLTSPSTAFGDGIRCFGGSMRRLDPLVATNGSATWPPAGAPPISVGGLVPAQGGTRTYAVYYRDASAYCTLATFNLTDAQRIVWLP